MISYVFRMKGQGTLVDGKFLKRGYPIVGWYVSMTWRPGTDPEIAGPFDDEYDAEMAARRAEALCE